MAAAVDVVVSSRTALQFAALARAMEQLCTDLGVEATLVEDRLPTADDGRITLVVAPHDVYPHLALHDEEALEQSLARTILVCCERPSAAGWAAVVPYAARAGAVFDVSAAGVATLEQHRVPARRFQLGYHESLDRWGGGESERPIDVAFLGSASPRRLQTLAATARVLSDYTVDLRVTDDMSADAQRRIDHAARDDRWNLLARSKLVLNVHRDHGLSFEWLRAVTAICNGCVVVAEEAVGAGPLEPGVHYVSAAREDLPEVAGSLLRDPDRIAQIRETAYRWVREEVPLRDAVERLVEAADTIPTLRHRRARSDAPAFPQPSAAAEAVVSEDPDLAVLLQNATELIGRQGSVMKRLFFDLRLLRRQVAELQLSMNGSEDLRLSVSSTPGFADASPEVSVLVTVYNYEGYVREALESVLASEGVAIEVIVVDDASIDRSADAVKQLMTERPDTAITLIQQAVNTGVQRARNLGFSQARAPYVFVLDADNLVFAHGIRKLLDAIEGDEKAAFAYGLIERFSGHEAIDLLNTRPWDRELLAQAHYIDAMALIRVSAFEDIGGYVTDPTLELGWEDYDLWLSFAGAGYHAAHLREIVGRYRVHDVSSLTITTLDTEVLKAKLHQRHARFFESVRPRG
ncbi:MAG: glycosyltransferase [Actinomycetota bacterium]